MIRKPQTVSTPLDGVTATTTSAAQNFVGVKRASWVFTRADHSSGSSTFTVEVSADGTTWVAYNKLISNVTNDAGAGASGVEIGLTRVASVVLSSNTSSTVSMDMSCDTYPWARVIVTEATDGTHTAKLVRDYA